MTDVAISFSALKHYCERSGFKGYDPYDGLNSVWFRMSPFRYSRICRLAWIQAFKRSPVNLRPLALIAKDYNPKGLGLFLTGYCNLVKTNQAENEKETMDFLIKKILELASPKYDNTCWGYNFDWQSRAFFQPRYTPTVVATSFIAYALLDAYDLTGDDKLLGVARSAGDFVLQDLNRTYNDKGDFAFSYSPKDHTQVFNASLLGARLLSRLYTHTNEPSLAEEAKRAVNYCADHQRSDGSWKYGSLPIQGWIDNFHTGYNLECIAEYAKHTGDQHFNEHLKKGLDFYLNTFFTDEGMSKYYHDKTYPIDIHAPAQLVVTLYRMGVLEQHSGLVKKVLDWTITNMQNKKGFFYYRKFPGYTNKIPYARWGQAWMFYALSFYLRHLNESAQG